MTAPDTAITSYQYFDLETRLTNPRGNATRSLLDVWGRTVQVIPLNGTNINSPLNPQISYVYNQADQLTNVINSGATMTMTYSLAGRKTMMNDPDMGKWYYTYEPLGNLQTQTDARACTTTLAYDALNRPTGKSYSGAGCGATTAVNYTYDAYNPAGGQYGYGFRTGMSDASGTTAWTYNPGGQVESETRSPTGFGSFRTEWGYNSAGLPAWMRYPQSNNGVADELVNYTYLPQMALNQVYGSYTYTYQQSASYDSTGRMVQRSRGQVASASLVQTQYSYYPWSTSTYGGQLESIQSGRPYATPSPLPTDYQDLRYTYNGICW